MGISSDASLQGLAQFSNTAKAFTSTGAADAEAFAQQLQGADLTGLKVGGEANVVGQATLSNLSTAESVTGAAEAESKMGTGAQGLVASGATFIPTVGKASVAGLDVASDAGLTGLASITNNATAKTSTGAVSADAIGTSIQGANLNSVLVGGVGTIGGQATYNAKASAENVNGDASTAKADLTSVDGLVQSATAPSGLDIKSDATIQGLASINNDAVSSSTGATSSNAIAEANTLTGANLGLNTDIGGIASITGQVNFGSKATGENVTGNSLASASLGEQTGPSTFSTVIGETGLAQGLVTGTDLSGEFGTDIKSDATIKGLSTLNMQAEANTTNGVADADAYAGTIDGANLGDVQVGGIGTLAGQSSFTGKAASSNVTGGASTADAMLVDADGMEATAGLNIKSDAGITGLNTTNLSAIAESVGDSTGDAETAIANASAQFLQGAQLGAATIGGIGNVIGQTNFRSLADASNVTGSASATGNLGQSSGFVEGLDLSGPMDVKSDATVRGLASINSTANAETTKGDAQALAQSDLINGADLTNGRLDIGGIGSITGQANFNFTASAENVEGSGAVDALGVDATADSDAATGLIGKTGTAVANSAGIDVSSDATLSGMAIGALKATASSTADTATATAGAGDKATGALLPSLNVGGLANLTGAAQLDSSANATNVGSSSLDATALAGQGQVVTGLTTGENESGPFANPTKPAAGANDASFPDPERIFGPLNVNVASDAKLTAQGFSNLDATASSTAGDAIADAGNDSSKVTGIAAGMDIKVGGVSDLTALAQGTADASAESVTGLADAFSAQSALGINLLEMQSASDNILKSTASVVGGADAVTTGNDTNETAWAAMDFDATGINGLAMKAGGIGDLNVIGSVTGSSDATSVAGPADARADIDAMGLQDAWFSSASDGTITGIGKVVSDLSATSTASTAKAEGDFDATGIKTLEAGIGGVSILKGQAQVTAGVSAESVSGSADAFSGVELGGGAAGANGFDVFFTGSPASSVIGLSGIELKGASDGTLLGTASGAFNTSADSTFGDANAQASQFMKGISSLNLDLGGNGGINAIVQDTNFVSAHSVSGNATSVASVDAIGLDGGNMHIAGNATIMATVGVDSKSEAHTIS